MNAKERLIDDIPCEGNRVRSASDASLSSSDRPHELRRRTGNFNFQPHEDRIQPLNEQGHAR